MRAISAPAEALVAVADAGGITHLVREDALRTGRHAGRFAAACGAEVLPASLSEPDRGHCGACYRKAAG